MRPAMKSPNACLAFCRMLKFIDCTLLHTIWITSAKQLDNIEKDDNDNECKLYNPPLRTLYGYRVIICTLSTAGSLTKERADSSIYSPRHFQYVFIDECASSHETMTLIPIAGERFSFQDSVDSHFLTPNEIQFRFVLIEKQGLRKYYFVRRSKAAASRNQIEGSRKFGFQNHLDGTLAGEVVVRARSSNWNI